MKRKKVIPDKRLPELMKKIRDIIGPDVQVVFRTTNNGSRLIGTLDDNDDDEGDTDHPDFDFEDDPDNRFDIDYPKIKNLRRKKDLRPNYFG